MNKRNKIFLYNLLLGGVLVVAAFTINHFYDYEKQKVLGAENEIVDCDYYFDENNGYTSIYEIVDLLNTSSISDSYKTWGTVSKYYVDSSNYKNFYMQSTDQNGNVAGIMIYRSSISVAEGSVLTVEGYPTLYNNLPEFNTPTSIAIDYGANSSPVTTRVTNETFWQNATNRSSSEFLYAQSLGTIEISIQDVELSYAYSGNAIVTIGTTDIPLYYSYLNETSNIDSVISSLDGYMVDIIGYLNCFDNGYDAKMQILIRSSSDIIAEGIEYSLTLNTYNYINIGSYSTGNYQQVSLSGYYLEHYRAIRPINYEAEFIVLLPYVNFSGDGSLPGSLYNISSINDIYNIAITYRTESIYGSKPILSYGPSPMCESSTELDLTTSVNTITIEVTNVDFFKIETAENRLFIHSIEIDYANEGAPASFDYLSSGENQVRINPITSSGDLYNGKSVAVPSSIIQNGNYYAVQTTKTYTYYTYDYFVSNPQLVETAAYTNPIDVAAFYTIFGTYPSNYVNRYDYSSAYYIFGNLTRCVSYYTRTDGYATAVPYKGNYDGIPAYYECDIALDSSYSSNNRGVGRVVCWDYGFDPSKGALDYDSSPVAVYTDDHYATFYEYLNAGSFGTRFNAELSSTNYIWGLTTTLLTY